MGIGVEKIIVHAPEKIDGDRVQEVEIYLRFIGRFELPVTELTEEEIKRYMERFDEIEEITPEEVAGDMWMTVTTFSW